MTRARSAYAAILAAPRDILTAALRPDASAQFRRTALVVDSWPRVALVGGDRFEPIAEFDSMDAAHRALKAAVAASVAICGEAA